MKKFVCAILTMVMVLSVAAIASAATAGFTIYNVPCKDIGNDQIYQYHGDRYVVKLGTDHIVQIKHRVTQTSAVENAYRYQKERPEEEEQALVCV